MGVRRQSRHAALQALFMCDFQGDWQEENIQFCLEHFTVPAAVRPYAERLCCGVAEKLSAIDSKLTCASENWSLSRMGRVDKAILRMATFEILFLDEVPVNVAINEAIEVAKSFGAEESPIFVNGVLDKVASSERLAKQGAKSPSRLAPEVLRLGQEAQDSEDLPLEKGASLAEKILSE